MFIVNTEQLEIHLFYTILTSKTDFRPASGTLEHRGVLQQLSLLLCQSETMHFTRHWSFFFFKPLDSFFSFFLSLLFKFWDIKRLFITFYKDAYFNDAIINAKGRIQKTRVAIEALNTLHRLLVQSLQTDTFFVSLSIAIQTFLDQ